MSLFEDSYGDLRVSVILASVLLVIAAVVTAAILTFVPVGVHYGRVNCGKFAEASHRAVKFVRYSYWSWDCYTPDPTDKAHWIPIGQLRGTP